MLPGGGHPISPGGGHPCPTLTHLAESPPSFARDSALAESAGEPCCGASLSPQPRPHCQGARGPSWEQHRAAAPVPSAGLPAGFGIRTQEHLDASEQVTTGSRGLCQAPGAQHPTLETQPGASSASQRGLEASALQAALCAETGLREFSGRRPLPGSGRTPASGGGHAPNRGRMGLTPKLTAVRVPAGLQVYGCVRLGYLRGGAGFWLS